MTAGAYPTPLEAAREDIPARYSPALFVEILGDDAVVLLGTNGGDDLYPYQVLCHRVGSGWEPRASSTMNTNDPKIGLVTLWDKAPATAVAALVRYADATYRIPTYRQHFMFTTWSARLRTLTRVTPEVDDSIEPLVVDPAEVVPVAGGEQPIVVDYEYR